GALPDICLVKKGQDESRSVTFYSYDNRNRLIKAEEGTTVSEYQYNAEGYRVSKSVNGQVTRYLYEGSKVILETDSQGNATARNIYGTNLLSRTILDTSTVTMYYMYNAHGDVTALIYEDGTIA